MVRYEHSAGVSAHPKTSSAHAYATRSALLFVSHDLRLAARFDRVIDLPSLNRAATDLNNAEVSR